jgi:hypothetical protein
MTGAFYGFGQHPLMSCAGASLPAGPDLSFFSNESMHGISLFIIDFYAWISTKLAYSRS